MSISFKKIFFISIFILSVFLRFYDLQKIPTGFYTDEAAFGYNAYSLLTTQRDEFGARLPFVFHSFGDYKSPLFFYYLIPYVGLFDLNIMAVRSGAAVLGVGIVAGIFFLTSLLTRNNRLSLTAMLIASITPLSLQFNRMVHENNLSVFLLLYGLIFFLKSAKNKWYLLISGVLFGLSIYAYHDAKILTPLLLVGLFLLYRKKHLPKIGHMVIFLFPVIILAVILTVNLSRGSGLHRPLSVLVFNNQGTFADIIAARQDISYFQNKDITLVGKLLINKPVNYALVFLEHYLSHYSSSFLFFFGDPVKIYSTVGSGILLISFLPLLLIGFTSLFIRYINVRNILIYLLVIGSLPGALTQYVPSASRTFFLILPFSILIACGAVYLSAISRKKVYFLFLIMVSVLIISFEFTRFLNLYFFVNPVRYAKDWNYKREELVGEVNRYASNYRHIWFSKQVGEYIYPLFFNKVNPLEFQSQYKWDTVDKYGFQWVLSFGKYTFDTIPPYPWVDTQTLYIGMPENFDSKVVPLKIIKYPSGNPAYYILDYHSFPVPNEY